MSMISLGMKTSFSTNSSLYSTPCQSPGSLGSSLDSTHLSLQSKESLTTTGPSDNGGLLAIQLNQDNYHSLGRTDSRAGSCSSGSSLNSVRTLLPPSSNSAVTWKPDQCNSTKSQDPSKSISFSANVYWQSLIQLRQDLTLKLSGLKQQVQHVVHQLNELELEIDDKLNSMCQLVNNDMESRLMNGTAEVNGTYLISPIEETRKSIAVPNELRLAQLNQLIAKPVLQKLPAIVKGYLTRRLMTTSKVKNLIKTIKDTTILLDNYHGEEQVVQEEIDFHRRLMIQLEKSLAELHDVFFTENKSEQMKLISRTREIAVDKVLRLSTEARRLQAEKARKFVHDKRKDSPLTTNTLRSVKQSRKDELNVNQTEKEEKNPEERQEDKKEDKKEDKPEENPKEKQKDSFEKKPNNKQDADIEMKQIEDVPKEIELKSKPKSKIVAKTKTKAPVKPRKSAKNAKKVSSSSEEVESTTASSISPSLTPVSSSESVVPTPPSLAPPSTPSSLTETISEKSETSETTKSTKKVAKESAPKRPKREAVKRVTRAAKKS